MRNYAAFFPFSLLLAFFSSCASLPAEENREVSSAGLAWQKSGGIETATAGDGMLIVRANLREASLELVNPPESDSATVAQIAAQKNYAVLINAAMFAKDYKTSIGHMRSYERVNNPGFNSRLRGFLMFHPKNPGSPLVKIGGKEQSAGYHTAFQTHRMIDESEKILWKKGTNVHHQVGLVGVDSRSRVLFFFQPNLMDVHDMVASILALRLELKGLLYLDGGTHGAIHIDPRLGRGVNTWISLPNLLGLKASGQ